ncbi:DNA primase [Streptomyces sp. NPDC058961]|uniref:DNA primase n=1 Tax=unclassified Streptomyces TaxID=2593676 RepID=UPI000C2765C8|nr:DNA primase [Streptomyces sp. CB01201]PJN01836.1 DNA primase [Streptomyces sp. CB01201]
MNNRLGLGLAVGAGYLLGRTKKAKLAFGIGTLVMGKRLQLSPRAIADFAAAQLAGNPQFKEIGDQLRHDLRGVGKAATGALVNRQIEGLADRLHDRTLGVQDRISGVVPDVTGSGRDEAPEEELEEEPEDGEEEGERPAKSSSKPSSRSSSGDSGRRPGAGSGKSAGRSPSRSSARASDSDSDKGASSARRSTGRTAAKSASSRASSAKKATKSVQRTAKRAPAKKTASRRGGQGGEDRG